MPTAWLLLAGCSYGLTLPSSTPAPDGPPEVGKTVLRERRALLGGTTPPPPEPIVGSAACRTITDGGPIGDTCITGEIACGEALIGHTKGGVRVFDSAFYRRSFCTPDTTDHDDGGERVYRLVLPPGDRRAWVTLDTPCADLDLAVMRWSGDDCPRPEHKLSRCEMFIRDGTARETVELSSTGQGTEWLVVVEGKGEDEGAFGLSVQCAEGLFGEVK